MAHRMLIDGRLRDGTATIDVINPATGKVFAQAPRADRAMLEEAVAAAKRAFPGWAGRSFAQRRVFLPEIQEFPCIVIGLANRGQGPRDAVHNRGQGIRRQQPGALDKGAVRLADHHQGQSRAEHQREGKAMEPRLRGCKP